MPMNDSDARPQVSAPHRLVSRGLLAVALLSAAAGCQTGGVGPLSRWRMAFDDSLAKPPTSAETGQDTRGLLSRWLHRQAPGTSSQAPEDGSMLVLGSDGWSPMKPPSDPAADAEYKAAEALLKQGKRSEAERAFARIARRRKNSHWGEKAQFQVAEIQFEDARYMAAHDSFEQLLTTYPGTRFLDKAVAREFALANYWLSLDRPDAQPSEWGDRFQGKRPPIDASGHALRALEHVRHHDPTGPLADDAVMKIADHYYQAENWEEAALYYDQLLSEHPKSAFVEQAMLSGIDAKLKGYIGPDYDGTGLEQARNQVSQVMANFPERQAAYSDDMNSVLGVIDDQMAERMFKRGEHYLWTGKVAAAEYCFGAIPVKWPRSPLVQPAKAHLAQLATMPRKETQASKIMTLPGGSDPLTGSSGVSAGGIGPNSSIGSPNGMGMGGISGGP